MDDLRIITLPVERWQEYRALRLHALQESPQAFGSSYAENAGHPDEFWINRLRDVAAGRTPLLFAEAGDRLVGLIGAFFDPAGTGVAAIFAVFIVPECRGRGLGGRLVDAILAELRQRPDARVVRLAVNVSQTAAISAYRRAGFTVVATELARMGDGVEHDELIMELALQRQTRD
ncbi:MAG: GNAT family N-acetyltransferase [Thermomicrobiales bacterium]